MTATIAEIEVPADAFAAHDSLTAVDGISFDVERIVAHAADRVMPLVWVAGDGAERAEVETAFAEDSTVDAFELLYGLGDEWLYRMEWVEEITLLTRVLVEEEGTILDAVGTDSTWHFRIVFPEREALANMQKHCETHGLDSTVSTIYNVEEERKGRFGLTAEQQNLLEVAYEAGYFDVPRRSNTQDIADELGVNHQSVSEMFRRAHRNLLANTVMLGHGVEAANDDSGE